MAVRTSPCEPRNKKSPRFVVDVSMICLVTVPSLTL